MHPEYRFRRLWLWAGLLSLAVAIAPPVAAAKSAGNGAQVLVVLLPNGTPPQALEGFPALAPGLLSAGIGEVPAQQTYLDVGQGNRVSERLYDDRLPTAPPRAGAVPHWGAIVDRAEAVPANLVPGLLAAAAERRANAIGAATRLGRPALIAADRRGRIARFDPRTGTCPLAVCVLQARPDRLSSLLASLRSGDLLIALERPPPPLDEQLTIAIAGRGFAGNLTSDSTRLRGYVLATDLAPTILRRLRVPVPGEMAGEPIRAEGERDVEALVDLEERLATIVDRRGSVIGTSALVWLALALLAIAVGRGPVARPVLEMTALTAIYLPAALLVGSALQPSEGVERLAVLAGAPLLAAATLALAPGYRALAIACAVAAGAFAVDVIAGSPLTRLSLIGSNPGLGVRFYGIGNELEAILVPLVLVGTGAALTAARPDLDRRPAALAFLAVAFVFALVFAAGRFGADVGAAIALPAGAAAAAVALGATGRVVVLVLVAPLAALALLAAADLALGGDAHLTRSVLDAGGLDEVADVAERRLRLSADSFGRALDVPLFWIAIAGIAVAVICRRRVLAWFDGLPLLRAGFLGAVSAVLVATLANDSGVLLLEVGTIYLLLIAGFAWAQARAAGAGRERARARRAA